MPRVFVTPPSSFPFRHVSKQLTESWHRNISSNYTLDPGSNELLPKLHTIKNFRNKTHQITQILKTSLSNKGIQRLSSYQPSPQKIEGRNCVSKPLTPTNPLLHKSTTCPALTMNKLPFQNPTLGFQTPLLLQTLPLDQPEPNSTNSVLLFEEIREPLLNHL